MTKNEILKGIELFHRDAEWYQNHPFDRIPLSHISPWQGMKLLRAHGHAPEDGYEALKMAGII